MGTVRAAVIYSALARFFMRFIGLGTTMVVARLLTPEEIGTYAIASAIVMVMVEFRLLGAGNYLEREEELTSEKIRSALGLTVLICWGLGGVILASGWPLAGFYDLPSLTVIFSILSVSFFIAPYISIPTALLSRKLSFRIQFRIRVTASFLSSVTTICLILLGFSYYSLAIGQLMTPLTQFVILSCIRPDDMEYRPSFRNLKPIARFGVFTSLALLIRKANVTVPDMIIGKMGTTRDVAMFSRGLGLIEFISQTIIMSAQPVALPFLSKTRREGADVTAAYTKASVLIGAVVVPALGVSCVASLPAIRLFFGDQWDQAAPVASWLAIWAIFRCVHWFGSEALMAIGRETLVVAREGVPFLVLIPAIVLSYPYGLEATASAFLLAGIVDLFVTTLILHRVFSLKVTEFFRAWWSNLVTLSVCTAGAVALDHILPFETTAVWKVIPILMMTMPLLWFLTLCLCRHPLYQEIMGMVRSRFPRYFSGCGH
ncbi:polysaccharide biosynthesis protein [Tamilnaduibacter salinus]|uniref:Polysaccharide biosynthesis protein n=1 Tax=Tamilnaduibacter salinus TaxID=1484056 RepID=A0A2A2I6N3_9GAMM|nr:lipopolysaccharide biosynthesis protein [Tamilnaduibacter salinus]PAV27038.1 polysaccharide biosynthesis protein [Tamilnaduibacter salinus]